MALYALRDELRHLAFENRELLSSDVFRTLDSQLTVYCATLHILSLWTILPSVLMLDSKRREGLQRDFEAKLKQPKNVVLLPIYQQSSALLARHLAWRHMFLSAVVGLTIVGFVLCFTAMQWLSNRILSAALWPITPPVGVRLAA